jgi:plastocyanin
MKKPLALLVLALAAAALVACGGGDDDGTTSPDTGGEATNGSATGGGGEATKGTATDGGATNGGAASGGGSTVTLEADPSGGLSYTTTEASAKAGDVTIDFTNPQPIQHDVVIEESGTDVGGTELIAEESTSATLQDLKPGAYTFYCSVPGHREGGMEGTLTVK